MPGIDKPVIVVTGEVTGTETWTSSNYYVLRGAVFVRDGATLNIQAGTRVIGESGSVGTLIVERGGRLNAIGTRAAPIVFTSDQPVGSARARRLGRHHHQRPRPGQHPGRRGRRRGRHGRLRRHRSERQQRHAALRPRRVRRRRVQPGQRAERHRVPGRRPRRHATNTSRSHMNRDDALEWFGGTADIKHAVVVERRRRQLRLDVRLERPGAVHRRSRSAATMPTTASRRTTTSSTTTCCRASNPQIYNITMCGDPDRNEGGESPRAANFRRGTAFTFRNFLITGFKTDGLPDRNDQHGDHRPGRQRHVADGRRRRLEHARRPTALERRRPYINSGRFPNVRTGVDAGRVDGRLLESRGAELPADRRRDAGRRPARADSAAERRLLRAGHVHRRRAARRRPTNWMTGWTSFPQR